MEEFINQPWVRGTLIGAGAGALKAATGVWKNHPNADFQFKFKKIVPAIVIGGAAGAVIGAQGNVIDDVTLQATITAFGAIGIDEILENVGKGIHKRIVDSGPWQWIFG